MQNAKMGSYKQWWGFPATSPFEDWPKSSPSLSRSKWGFYKIIAFILCWGGKVDSMWDIVQSKFKIFLFVDFNSRVAAVEGVRPCHLAACSTDTLDLLVQPKTGVLNWSKNWKSLNFLFLVLGVRQKVKGVKVDFRNAKKGMKSKK